MPNRNYHNERREYDFGSLDEHQLQPDPFQQFAEWVDFAFAENIHDPTAMTLATADAQGQPHARIVLLKSYDADGFVFYTHYDSDKGKEIAQNPLASLLFFWPAFDRQIRLEGTLEKLRYEASDAYFQSRPRDSQLSAAISKQSQPVSGREALEQSLATAAQTLPEQIPCPKTWGGYRLIPHRFEFWQGRPNRLHDRFIYTPIDSLNTGWQTTRLSP